MGCCSSREPGVQGTLQFGHFFCPFSGLWQFKIALSTSKWLPSGYPSALNAHIHRCHHSSPHLLACLLQFVIAAAKAFDPEKHIFELSCVFSRQHKQLGVHCSAVQLCTLAPQGIQFQDFAPDILSFAAWLLGKLLSSLCPWPPMIIVFSCNIM